MLRKNVLKGILGGSAVALLAVALVHAQTTDPQTGSKAGTTGTQGAGSTGSTGSTATTGTTASGGATSGTLSRADRKIIMDLAQANMSEIETGRLAQSKSQNEQVKNYAQQMIDDHTKALSEVQQLAQARNITVPTQLDRTNKAKLNRLGGLNGEAFDRAYMARAAVADHKKTHDMLQQAQSRAKDAEVKALVARTLPIVDQHLTSGQQLHKDTAQGSSRTQGTTGSSTDKKNE